MVLARLTVTFAGKRPLNASNCCFHKCNADLLNYMGGCGITRFPMDAQCADIRSNLSVASPALNSNSNGVLTVNMSISADHY